MPYISIFIGSVLNICASYVFFNRIKYHYLCISLLFLTSPIPFFAYSQAWIIKWYIYFVYTLLIFLALHKYFHQNIKKSFKFSYFSKGFFYIIKKISLGNILCLILSSLITIILTYKSYPSIWRFNNHDVLYYSWLNDIFNINYSGSIRVPSAFPYQFSANHLLAGSILSPFLIFTNKVNIYSSYSVKYFLTFIAFTQFNFRFIFNFWKKQNKLDFVRIYFAFVLLLAAFSIYSPVIDSSLALSNFPIIFSLLALGTLCFDSNKPNLNSNNRDFTLQVPAVIMLLTCLLISKASTFPTFLITIIFILFNYLVIYSFNLRRTYFLIIRPFFQKNIIYLFISFLVLILSFLSWIIKASNHGSIIFSSPLCLLTTSSADDVKSCLFSFFTNPFFGWFVSTDSKYIFLKNFSFLSDPNLLVFIAIWSFSILPTFCLGLFLKKRSKKNFHILFGNISQFYALATAFNVVFIRESLNFSGDHVAHSYYLCPLFTVVCICLLLIEFQPKINSKVKYLVPLTFLNIVLFNYVISNTSVGDYRQITKNLNEKKNLEPVSLTFNESKQFDDKLCPVSLKIKKDFINYLDSNGCADSNLAEIKFALEGRRSQVSFTAKDSIIKQWVLK